MATPARKRKEEKILDLITKLFKDLIDDYTKTIDKLDTILSNVTIDCNKINKFYYKNGIIIINKI